MNVEHINKMTKMKKTYIAPSVAVASIQLEEMIAASLGVGASTSNMGGKVVADGKARRDAVTDQNEESWGNLW